MNDYQQHPVNQQDNNNKELRESNRKPEPDKTSLEKQGPNKGDFKVLNKDGSLADLPDPGAEGSGANAGSATK